MRNNPWWGVRALVGAAAVVACLVGAPSQAASVAIDTLNVQAVSLTVAITGGGTYTSSGAVVPPVTVQMGAYQDPIASGTATSGITTVGWKIYSAPGLAGNPAPTGTVDGTAGTINVDFSSLRGQLSLTSTDVLDFPLWPLTGSPTTSSYNGTTGAYDLGWSNDFNVTLAGLPTISGTATVSLAGTVSAVPLPAALWLFGSGLMGLVGVARRRMN